MGFFYACFKRDKTITDKNITPKQTPERVQIFAQALHCRETKTNAYRIMHPVSKRWKDSTVHVKACLWAKTAQVKAKLAELQAQSAERSNTTVDSIDSMHKEAFEIAKESKQAAAMTASAQNLAKLHGLIIDKKELSGNIKASINLIERKIVKTND